jgi:imidazole glycerol-phosphate synthase subunit HisF
MLRKRIIFTLIYSDGYFTQSRNFRLQKVGNIHWLENNYKFNKIAFSIDELIILDASKDKKDILKFSATVRELVKQVFIPIAAGGGIKSFDDAVHLFKNGADKVVINSSLTKKPHIVRDLIKAYGSQSIVASIDYKIEDNQIKIFIDNGTNIINYSLESYIKYLEDMNVGEIYLNSIDKDGTGFGYDYELVDSIADNIKIPLIIAGGAGNAKHLIRGLEINQVNAVATANLFNFIGDGLPLARKEILSKKINVANWNLE